MMDLHVIFGTGPLGQSVMRELLARGMRVRMVNTRGQASVPADVEVIKGDAYSIEATTSLARGAAVVYQCAMPPYDQWMEKFPAMQAAILSAETAETALAAHRASQLCVAIGRSGSKPHRYVPQCSTPWRGFARIRDGHESPAFNASRRSCGAWMVPPRGTSDSIGGRIRRCPTCFTSAGGRRHEHAHFAS